MNMPKPDNLFPLPSLWKAKMINLQWFDFNRLSVRRYLIHSIKY
jgi:hypothetical protein